VNYAVGTVARVITIERVITVDQPVETAFARTVKTVKVEGDGGPGTMYHNTSTFAGRETELEYVVQQLAPGRIFELRGENKTARRSGRRHRPQSSCV